MQFQIAGTVFLRYILHPGNSSLFIPLATLFLVLFQVGNLFRYSNITTFLVFLIMWILASISWNFLISVIFTNARLGLIFSVVLWYVSYVPAGFFDIDSTSVPVLLLLSLLPNSCLSFGITIFARFESKGVGVQWNMISESPSVDGSFTLFYAYIMFAVDCILFFLLTWYIEAVFPGKYGIPKPFYFPFQPSYWCGRRAVSPNSGSVTPDNAMEMDQRYAEGDNNHENEPNMEVGISVNNMTKVYKSAVGKKMAVDDLSLKMYKGQITALLGHNGAGKTTTMSILTGLFPPTAGSATVNGHDVVTDIEGVRSSLGLCPQHNVLFDRLTVKEHLDFFIKLKGKSGKEATREVLEMIRDLQLLDKTNEQSQKLSGGMKRKLSCAVALIGGSKIVILDEPTSGMDPYARRATWDLLLKYKAGKTMVLTTHFMDEADLLGDRIAIMANGQLITSGSSLFLKNRFGVGYHLTFVRNEYCDVPILEGLVKKHIPDSHLESCLAREVDFILPIENTHLFKDFFNLLESQKETLGVDSFGISVTTMEEVFMKVGDLAEAQENGRAYENHAMAADNGDVQEVKNGGPPTQNGTSGDVTVPMTSMGVADEEYLTGLSLKIFQFVAMFQKRLKCAIRDYKSWILQIVLPLMFVLLGLTVAKTGTRLDPDPPRELNLYNISSTAPGGSAVAFIADLREDRSTDYFMHLPDIMEELGLQLVNVTEQVVNLFYGNQDGLINGKEFNTSSDCCNYENLILNASCAQILLNESAELCADYSNFGYNQCPSCLMTMIPVDNSSDLEICTAEVAPSPYIDVATFFEEYVLENSKQEQFYFETHVAGFTIKDSVESSTGFVITGWYSNQAYHTSAEVLNALTNAFLKYFTNESYSVSVTNYPLPLATTTQATNSGLDPDTFNLAILILFGLSFLTASFLPFIITERSSKAKHLQLVSGLDRVTYWVANLSWDMVNYLIVYIILIACFAIFQVPSLSGINLGAVATTLLLFGWACIPFVYVVSTLFKTAVNGYAITTILLAIVGMKQNVASLPFDRCTVFKVLLKAAISDTTYVVAFITIQAFVIAVFVLQILDGNEKVAEVLDHIFMLLPTYAMTRAVFLLSTNHAVRDACTTSDLQMQLCEDFNITYEANNYAWNQPGIGQNLLYLALEGIVFFVLVLCSEFINFSSIFVSRAAYFGVGNEDEDVARERRRVHEMDHRSNEQAILIKDLKKTYFGADRPAVHDLCLAIPKGECFGLLGVNGAGKTTTFGMLTGDIPMSSGHAYIQGMSIRGDRRKAQRLMGYCPQFDALVERLTGREVLTMYARLRGIPSSSIPAVVRSTIEHLDLVKYADKLCGNYSGGNKRKLSTAIALVGSPPTVLLDEPTSGMDPRARRHLWNAILSVMREGKSVVLTSHSMEECEALCTRLAIMVNGQFKCLGSTQHLKSRFGRGYTLILKTEGDVNAVQTFVMSTFPGAQMLEAHLGTLHFQVYDDNMNWSRIFGTLEESKERLKITDYSVSQTPLEQVFINFAKEQFQEAKPNKGCCKCF
ncbi:ATP-binding cassette sub-family A member 1 [Holothuria leucospilota]|uniref:ATP-binding cassette sub-family A member 1 n=1 Tax=Holothuria leucospilota TaxID=206669 RepID=A0A9Q1C9Q8_HOLLE|nr:ATP-binding cassette sub-family A member 1 [Holothuria leucospilota]